jgi:hypothetical protein
MKFTVSLLFFLGLGIQCFSQTGVSAEKEIVIIACQKGDLYLDGTLLFSLDADDAKKHLLPFGEHYLQLKTTDGKYNKTVKVDNPIKEIIKLGCTDTGDNLEKFTVSAKPPVVLFDKQINLTGAIATEIDYNPIALDAGDEVEINCEVLNKKGTANLTVISYPSMTEIYKKESFDIIRGQKIKIPKKGIYVFSVSTPALFSKNVKLKVLRFPALQSDPAFNTQVNVKYDTSAVEVVKTVARVYSTTNLSNSNRTTVKINLPSGTKYWVYWIGVGQTSRETMRAFAQNLGNAAKLISPDPLTLFGLNVIGNLPILNGTSTVSYHFTDSQNAGLFRSKQAYQYYTFKHATNIATDYALANVVNSDIVLCMENNSALNGEDVEVRVMAFVVNSKLVYDAE